MRRKLVMALTGVLMGAMLTTGCAAGSSTAKDEVPAYATTEAKERTPNPVQQFDTKEDAEAAVGFSFAAPDTINKYGAPQWTAFIGSGMLQAIYANTSGSRVFLRKGVIDPDAPDYWQTISGDYNSYAFSDQQDIGGLSVRFSGDDSDSISLVVWKSGTYGYAIMLDVPTAEEDVSKIVADIISGENAMGTGTTESAEEAQTATTIEE